MRNAAFIGVGLLLILIQANLYRLIGRFELHGATPSLVLPLVIFLGVHETSTVRGAALSFVIGYLLDILASAPIGLFTFVMVLVWLLSRAAGVRLTAQTVLTRISLAFGFALVESFVVLTLLAIFGTDTRRPLEMVSIVLPRALATAICAPIIFSIAHKLHQSTAVAHASGGEAAR